MSESDIIVGAGPYNDHHQPAPTTLSAYWHRLLIVTLFLLCTALSTTVAQPTEPNDSVRTVPPTSDSLRVDSVQVSVNGFDQVVVYGARDSMIFTLDKKKGYLYGTAFVSTGNDRLEAAYIEIDFETKELYAEVRYDSLRDEYIGMPILEYAGERVSQKSLRYNFETGRGVSSGAETELEDGHFHADRIKRVDKKVAFAENGKFTYCDAPYPHYYFSASKMKLVTDDKIYADRLQLYIEGVPIITLPVSVFFAMGGGRHSGILIPEFRQTSQRGVELEGLGYFWAVNDYLDTRFTTDLSTKGGYNFNNRTRFRLRGVVERSDLEVTLGRSRTDVDLPLETSWIFGYDHNQRLGKYTTLSGELNFTSKDAIRQTTTSINDINNLEDITTQDISSNFDFATQLNLLGLDLPFSIGYERRQNIVTEEIEPEAYRARLGFPNWTPFARSGPDILNSLSLRLNMDANQSFVRRDTLPDGAGFRTEETRRGINIRPSLGWTPKLSYFTINPTVTLNASVFPKRLTKQVNSSGEIDTTFINGIQVPFWWSTGLNISTNLYGIVQPRLFGVNAVRHRVTPTIGFSFSPDFADPSYGYVEQYIDPTTNNPVSYSVFEADQGAASIPSSGTVQRLTWSLSNSFEAKIAQGDTLEDRNVTLLNLNLTGGGYNFADSLTPFSAMSLSASTDLGRVGNLSASATLDPYEVDTLNRRVAGGMPFPWVRVSNASVSFNTSFSSSGFNTQSFVTRDNDSIRRGRSRFDVHRPPFNSQEYWGERVRGNRAYRIPWQASFGGTYTLTPQPDGEVLTNFNVNTSFSFSLTPTVEFRSSASYDLEAGRFNLPQITFSKDLHDWDMEIRWNQYSNSVFFRIGFTPSTLRDLEYVRPGF